MKEVILTEKTKPYQHLKYVDAFFPPYQFVEVSQHKTFNE